MTPVDNSIYIKDAFFNQFSKESFHISRFIDSNFQKKLIDLLTQNYFDFIQLETLVLAAYIPTIRQYSKAKIVMRSHNVEYEIWERITNNTSFFLKKWYIKSLTKKLKQFEISKMNQYDLFAAITDKDLNNYKALGLKIPSITIPIGLDIKDYQPDYSVYNKPLSLSFIGSLDWRPNLEGLHWFIEKIWTSLNNRFPNLVLHIAGRNTPKEIFALENKKIKIHGEVEEAKTFINSHPIMIVPLQSGSGMRVKILEGMALGRVVITSELGLEGINAKHKREVLIANNLEEYIEAIHFCINQPKEFLQIGKNAASFIAYEFDHKQIGSKLKSKMENILLNK